MKRKWILGMVCCLLACTAMAGNKTIDVTRCGMTGDGKTLLTVGLQQAIDSLYACGGGTLYFPAGRYLTGSLRLKSGITLHIEEGAVLLGSTSPYDYPFFSSEGELKVNNDNFSQALLVADGAERIGITGGGCVDGQGRELALTIDSLHHTGELVDPYYNTYRKRPNTRPKLVFFRGCSQVAFSNMTFRSSAAWGLSFSLCKDLSLDSLRIENRAYWNNDGIDVSDCKDVRISYCDVDAADDGICLKSHHREEWNDRISISHCRIVSSASAIKFGTESRGGFKNVTIDDIHVRDTYRSAIAIESVDGAEIENVSVSNVHALHTGNALFVRLGHRSGEAPGYLRNVSIRNLYAEIPFGRPDIDYDLRGPALPFFHNPFPCSISGIPGHRVENVHLENIEIVYPGRASKGMAYISLSRLDAVPENVEGYPEFSMFEELPAWGFYVRHVSALTMKNVRLHLEADDFRPAFVFDRVDGLALSEIVLPEGKNSGQVVLRQAELRQVEGIPENMIIRIEE